MLLSARSENICAAKERRREKRSALGCVSCCRNAVVNRITFPRNLAAGYEVRHGREFWVYLNGRPTAANAYLRPFNLRCSYTAVPNGRGGSVAALLVFHPLDHLAPAEAARARREAVHVLFSHGNARDIGHMFFAFARLCFFLKVNLVSYDYSGYGRSSGSPSELALYTNIAAVYGHVREALGVAPERIVLFGHSLGSAPSCFLVSQPERFPVGGLVLQSPLASGLRVFFRSVVRHHSFDAFDNAEFLKHCPLIPVFFMHGIDDAQIPLEQAVELTCVVKESHEAHLSRRLNQNNKFHLERIPNPELDAEHTHLNQEKIEIVPRGRFSQVITDARRADRTNQYVKTWWVEGAGHDDIEALHSAAFYDHLSKFLALCRRWRREERARGAAGAAGCAP